METTLPVKPPRWFWLISALALIWNLMGAMAFIMDVSLSEEAIAALTDLQREQRAARPVWYVVAFAIAVFAATLGCVGLLIRKQWAQLLLIVSFVGVMLQQLYHFVLSDIGKTLGVGDLVMTLMIAVIAVLLIFFSNHARAKNWLR